MGSFKKYFKNLYRFLSAVTVIIAILVFTTGKTKLPEYIEAVNGWFSSDKTATASVPGTKSIVEIHPESDNLLTTICKTFYIILAIVFLCFAAFISAILEIIIWMASFGNSSFYCTKQIWHLCWNEIVSNWFWTPAQSTYLWITFLLYGGFFGSRSVDKKDVRPSKSMQSKKTVRKKQSSRT